MRATIPKGNMGYDQYTVPNDCSCRTDFCCFPVALANKCPWPLVPFFSIFFGEEGRQNHPQYLSGLSRALFPTTFLETAVYKKASCTCKVVVLPCHAIANLTFSPPLHLKVIPLFCTAHPLLRITLQHSRWRRFFLLARKEQKGAAFAELKLLFAIIMPQIG